MNTLQLSNCLPTLKTHHNGLGHYTLIDPVKCCPTALDSMASIAGPSSGVPNTYFKEELVNMVQSIQKEGQRVVNEKERIVRELKET